MVCGVPVWLPVGECSLILSVGFLSMFVFVSGCLWLGCLSTFSLPVREWLCVSVCVSISV